MHEKLSVEYDPVTNVKTTTGVTDDKLVLHHEGDISANLDYATALRNSDQYSSEGIKKGFFHAAHIPSVVVVELLSIGVDVMRAPAKEILAGLRKLHKDHLITTRKRV
jgi:hypothetical protein